MKISRKEYKDKVHACFTGKNIGGTMGAPYEGKREMQNITGFNSPKGEPLGNDDLDLQLIWLCAVEERGIRAVTPALLGEYWLNYIPPHWNEYGTCKSNMKNGLMPPYSGEFCNEEWKNSNGAWIRTEVWACLFPGFPDLAVRYAYADACVDHGLGEGTYSAMFVAALESAAFYEKDIRRLIDLGLSYIPKDCKTAKTVRLAIELYDKGTSVSDARNEIVKFNEELGWFQAPANVAYVIMGLLYGDGDYKKSMITAINCGDDTDCTGATIGSIMGLMGGMSCVPPDWAEYIGDKICSVAIDLSYKKPAKTCTELMRRIYELVPSTLKAYGIYCEYTDEDVPFEMHSLPCGHDFDFEIPQTGLSQNFTDLVWAKGRVEFDKCSVEAGETLNLRFVLQNMTWGVKQVMIDLDLPEGWTSPKKTSTVMIKRQCVNWTGYTTYETTVPVTALENVNAKNVIGISVYCPDRLVRSEMKLVIWAK